MNETRCQCSRCQAGQDLRPGDPVTVVEPVDVTHYFGDVRFLPGEPLRVWAFDFDRGDGCVSVARADGLARRIPKKLLRRA